MNVRPLLLAVLLLAVLLFAVSLAAAGLSAAEAGAAGPADVTAAASDGDDWPTWQHDPQRTGRTTEFARVDRFPQSPQAAWKFSFPERVHFRMQPIVAGGIVYVGCMDGNLYAFEGETGTRLWTFAADGEITHAPTVQADVVVFGTVAGSVYGVHAKRGDQLWRAKTAGQVLSSPAAQAGRVFIGSVDGNLYAFDVRRGKELWRLPTGNKIVQAPAVKDGRVFVGSEDLHAYAADARTGERLWRAEVGGITLKWGYPVVAGDTVVFTTVQPGKGFAGGYKGGGERCDRPQKDETKFFDVRTGAAKFTGVKISAWYYNMIPPVVPDETSLWLCAGHLFRLDLSSGTLTDCGQHSPRGDERPSMTVGGDGLLYGVIDQDIFAYDVGRRRVDRNLWGTPYLHRKPPDLMIGDNLLRFSTGTGGGGAGCGSALVMSRGMGYTIVYSWLYAFKLYD